METTQLLARSQRVADPQGIYIKGVKPDIINIPISELEGPYYILNVILFCFAGANCALFGLYVQQYGGRKGDPWYLQLGVAVSVAMNVVFALMAGVTYFQRDYYWFWDGLGFDINALEWYIPPAHVFQSIPDAIGQAFFIVRIAKLFNRRNPVVQVVKAFAFVVVFAQVGLMLAFGACFYNAKTKLRIASDKEIRDRIRAIIGAWVTLFITIEISMTTTTVARLLVLRRKTTLDASKKMLFRLTVYSLQGQFALTSVSLASVELFSRSAEGWYKPYYLVSGGLYTIVMQANLLYRTHIAHQMRTATEEMTRMTRSNSLHAGTVSSHPSVQPHGSRFSATSIPTTFGPIQSGRIPEQEHQRDRSLSSPPSMPLARNPSVQFHSPLGASITGNQLLSPRHPEYTLASSGKVYSNATCRRANSTSDQSHYSTEKPEFTYHW